MNSHSNDKVTDSEMENLENRPQTPEEKITKKLPPPDEVLSSETENPATPVSSDKTIDVDFATLEKQEKDSRSTENTVVEDFASLEEERKNAAVRKEELEGKTLDVCCIERKLGEGGMGAVYLAQHTALQKKVALKILSPEMARNEKFVERFFREARSAAKLEHPNIVQVYDVRTVGEYTFIVMQYVEGTTLTEKINEGKLNFQEKLTLLLRAAEGISFAHKRDIIHRDIKADNIMISDEGEVKIADFGLAKLSEEQSSKITSDGQIIGTPDYIPPEFCLGEKATSRSDIYSLGIVFYFCFVGRVPFTAVNIPTLLLKHIHEEPEHPRTINPMISPSLNYIILKMMQKSPANRYATIDEMIEDLRIILSGQSLHVGKINSLFTGATSFNEVNNKDNLTNEILGLMQQRETVEQTEEETNLKKGNTDNIAKIKFLARKTKNMLLGGKEEEGDESHTPIPINEPSSDEFLINSEEEIALKKEAESKEHESLVAQAVQANLDGKFQEAITILQKVPKESSIFNDELAQMLTTWIEEEENRLLLTSKKLMEDFRYQEAIPLLDKAQEVNRKYNNEVVELLQICQSNLKYSNFLVEAQKLYQENKNKEALELLQKVRKTSLVYEKAQELEKEIAVIENKDQILEQVEIQYQNGCGAEALKILSEYHNAVFKSLEEKIRSVVEFYDTLEAQTNALDPDAVKIKKSAESILKLEKNQENYYNQQASLTLDLW